MQVVSRPCPSCGTRQSQCTNPRERCPDRGHDDLSESRATPSRGDREAPGRRLAVLTRRAMSQKTPIGRTTAAASWPTPWVTSHANCNGSIHPLHVGILPIDTAPYRVRVATGDFTTCEDGYRRRVRSADPTVPISMQRADAARRACARHRRMLGRGCVGEMARRGVPAWRRSRAGSAPVRRGAAGQVSRPWPRRYAPGGGRRSARRAG